MKEQVLKFIDNHLRSYCLGEITNFERPIKLSGDKVYGKDIRRYDKDGNEYVDELESWYITKLIDENQEVEKFIQELREDCLQKEMGEITCEERNKHTIHQLCDWAWLESDDGKIVRERKTYDGVVYEVTLVKYAKCLKDLD